MQIIEVQQSWWWPVQSWVIPGQYFTDINFVILFICTYILKFVFSMSIETTDDCGEDPYETGCLVESYPGLIKII